MKGLNLTILILVLFYLSPSHTQLLKRIRDRLKQRLGGESIGMKHVIFFFRIDKKYFESCSKFRIRLDY